MTYDQKLRVYGFQKRHHILAKRKATLVLAFLTAILAGYTGQSYMIARAELSAAKSDYAASTQAIQQDLAEDVQPAGGLYTLNTTYSPQQ